MTNNEKTYWDNWRTTLDAYTEANDHTVRLEITAELFADKLDRTTEKPANEFRALQAAFETLRKEADRAGGLTVQAEGARHALSKVLETAARSYFPEIAAILYGEE